MAKVAETIVEEWLNRQGYFTVRGLKSRKGPQTEIDLLAYHPADGTAKHVEVQASPKPAGILGGGKVAELSRSVREYVGKKYERESVQALHDTFYPVAKEWQQVLVYHTLNHEDQQCEVLKGRGIRPVPIADILRDLRDDSMPFKTDSDASNFLDLG